MSAESRRTAEEIVNLVERMNADDDPDTSPYRSGSEYLDDSARLGRLCREYRGQAGLPQTDAPVRVVRHARESLRGAS